MLNLYVKEPLKEEVLKNNPIST